MTKATPARLAQLRKDRFWTMQRLADQIYDRVHVRVSMWTLMRYIKGRTKASEPTQAALDKFLALERAADHEAAR